MPEVIDLYRRLEGQGLALIGVHTKNAAERMPAYVKETEIPFPVAVDSEGKTIAAYAVDSYPDYYLIDRAGILRVADLANGDVERAVKALLAERAPTDASAAATTTTTPGPIAFDRIDRSIAKLPELVAPRYGLFLFGPNGERRVWAVLDKSEAGRSGYDVLYLDRNADGDLTGADERFAGDAKGKFAIGDFQDPVTGARHADFTVNWSEASVRYRMLWRGEKVTMGGYGPERSTYASFAATPAEAPVFVPGWDRPFQFEHWMSGELTRGQETDFKVFVGNRGDRTGAFSTVDDKYLPEGEYPVATLIYTDTDGKEQRYMVKLTERC